MKAKLVTNESRAGWRREKKNMKKCNIKLFKNQLMLLINYINIINKLMSSKKSRAPFRAIYS